MDKRADNDKKESPGTTRVNRTIVLVGLMGAGKTSVGKRVASRLDIRFVDSDNEIQEAAGMSIPEIFAAYGEPAFRDVERRVIARLLCDAPCILATGGGAFLDTQTRNQIACHGRSVWLRADVDVLWDRVSGRPGRPLLNDPDPYGVLKELHAARAPIYAQADVVVDSFRGISHEAMANAIIDAVIARDADVDARPPAIEVVENEP